MNLCNLSKRFRPQFECEVFRRDGLDGGKRKSFHHSRHTSIQSASKMYEVKRRELDDMRRRDGGTEGQMRMRCDNIQPATAGDQGGKG